MAMSNTISNRVAAKWDFVASQSDREKCAALKAEAERLKAELSRMERNLEASDNKACDADRVAGPLSGQQISKSQEGISTRVFQRGEVGEALAVLAAQHRAESREHHRSR